MIRRLSVYAVVVVLAALAVPMAGAAVPPKAAPLAGVVTLSGSAPGYVPVTVPKDTFLGDPLVKKYRDSVKIQGGGVAAGFALVRDGLGGTILVGGASRAFAPLVQRIGVQVLNLDPNGTTTADSAYVVPAGSYRLYLVTGGKPTTVTLRFGGLAGRTRLCVTKRTAGVAQGGPLTATAPGPAGIVYSGGQEARLTTPLIQMYFNRFDADVHTESVTRFCFFVGKPQGPQPYGPACASPDTQKGVLIGSGSQVIQSDEYPYPDSYYSFGTLLVRPVDPKMPLMSDFGGGAAVTSASTITKTDYSQFWIPLN